MTSHSEISVPKFIMAHTDDTVRLIGSKAVFADVRPESVDALAALAEYDDATISRARLFAMSGEDPAVYEAVVDALSALEGPPGDLFESVNVTVDDISGDFPTEEFTRLCTRRTDPGGQEDSAAPATTLEIVVQTAYDPSGTKAHDWSTPTLYAYILGDTGFIDPVWWRNSGRACHTCAQRAYNRGQNASSKSLRMLQAYGELLYAKSRSRVMASSMELNAFAYGIGRLIGSVHRGSGPAFHPGRYLHVLHFGSMDWRHVLVPSKLSCLDLPPSEQESLETLF
jgi:hypothetical protein